MKWKSQKTEVQNFVIPKCYKPPRFGKVKKAEFHQLTDASVKDYSQSSYLRMTWKQQDSPFLSYREDKNYTFEIDHSPETAAVVSVSVSEQLTLRRELDINITNDVFCTDSRVILNVFANDVRRFHVFVANRVQEIPKHRLQSNRQCFQGQGPTEFRKWIKVPEFRDCGVRTLRHTHPAYTDCVLIPNYTLTPFIWDSGCGH